MHSSSSLKNSRAEATGFLDLSIAGVTRVCLRTQSRSHPLFCLGDPHLQLVLEVNWQHPEMGV